MLSAKKTFVSLFIVCQLLVCVKGFLSPFTNRLNEPSFAARSRVDDRRNSLCTMKAAVSSKKGKKLKVRKSLVEKSEPGFLDSLSEFDITTVLSGSVNSEKSIQRRALLKEKLVELCENTQNGNKCSDEKRDRIEKIVERLETLNPTVRIGPSELLDGKWKLLYTTNGGSSSGKLGPFVGSVIQDIDTSAFSYDNIVSLGAGLVEGRLTATWKNIDSNTWQVIFQDLVFKVFGIPLVEKTLKAKGIWRMTYLDDNLRILYAKGGKNKKEENVYILAK